MAIPAISPVVRIPIEVLVEGRESPAPDCDVVEDVIPVEVLVEGSEIPEPDGDGIEDVMEPEGDVAVQRIYQCLQCMRSILIGLLDVTAN